MAMKLTDFHFDLPDSLIAQQPLKRRTASRLLVLDGASREHRQFADLPGLLQPGDHLVFNDTRVIYARLAGAKASGGRLECLVERVLPLPDNLKNELASEGTRAGAMEQHRLLAQIRASKSPRTGSYIELAGSQAEVVGRDGGMYELLLELPAGTRVHDWLKVHGALPLPPYIQRPATENDAERYQTVFARRTGAVAAPTAGLHFDKQMFADLAARGIEHSFITLHVGAGTFQPVRTEDIHAHHMHPEWLEVPEDTVTRLREAKERGGRIIAVGTTSVRALETAAADGELTACKGDSRLFLSPGSPFHVVDGMVTNFHLPESTLLMLVSAFAGHADTLAAYREAVARQYRFFSYGDSMLAWPCPTVRSMRHALRKTH